MATAFHTASACCGATAKPVSFSIRGSACSMPMSGQGIFPRQLGEPAGDGPLGAVQVGEERARRAGHGVGDEQLGDQRAELVDGRAAVSLLRRFVERVADTGAYAGRRRFSMPSFMEIVSAPLKPIPRMFRASR